MDTAILPEMVAEQKQSGMMPPHYPEIILASQKSWRSLYRKELTRLPFSQGRDVSPKLIASLTRIVGSNLPSYLPDDIKTRINSFPPPIVSFGTIIDERFLQGPTLFYEVEDDLSNPKENTAKQTGINLLNEIAIDTLAQETLGNIGARRDWFKPMGTYLKIDNPIRPAYISGLKYCEKQLGGKQNFEVFRRNLIISALSGNTALTDNCLHEFGLENLESFACQLGKSKQYAPLEANLFKLLDKSVRIKSSLSGGFIHNSFPGVIFIPQVANLLYVANLGLAIKYMQDLPQNLQHPVSAALNLGIVGLTGYLGLKAGTILPHLFTHELFHYYSSDIDHWGLKKVNYLPPN